MSRKPAPNYGAMENTTNIVSSDMSTSDFKSLGDSINTYIYTINSNLKILYSAIKAIGTYREYRNLADKIHVVQISMNRIIIAAMSSLQQLNKIVRKDEKQWRLQVNNLTHNFKDALADYSSFQKITADKMKTSVFLSPEKLIEMDKESLEAQNQVQMVRELTFEYDTLMDQEEVELKNVEADILTITEIMRDLIVFKHQEEKDLDSSQNNTASTTQANGELHGTSCNIRFCYALTGIVLVNVLIFLIIMVVVVLKH